MPDCDGCSHICLLEGCGNNRLECAEVCDDGTNLATYGGAAQVCGPGCQYAPYCGDSVVSNGEECDEGPANGSGYGHCSSTCNRPAGT